MNNLSLKNVSKVYQNGGPETVAINDVTLTFPEKGMVFILGKSGSGKSTLLNVISGMDKVTSGEIRLGGRLLGVEIDYDFFRNKTAGFIFQEINLNRSLNVLQNVLFSDIIQNRRTDKKRALRALERVGMGKYSHRRVNRLSGGEAQ
ncbi:MAG: ATP-binding cassette domain-containing protein, partial [Clostridiales bacterium]|nr:ATP-binding cassette domain-containing protein [Clostridiales bacterium]